MTVPITKTFMVEDVATGEEIAVFTITAMEIKRCLGRNDGSIVVSTGKLHLLVSIPESRRLREVKQ